MFLLRNVIVAHFCWTMYVLYSHSIVIGSWSLNCGLDSCAFFMFYHFVLRKFYLFCFLAKICRHQAVELFSPLFLTAVLMAVSDSFMQFMNLTLRLNF